MKILIEGSARHVHLSRKDVDTLFGKGFALSNKRNLLQPGEFLTNEKVTLIGPKRKIERVSVLGPERPKSQAEISKTDARTLGVDAPLRLSGDLAGSAPIIIEGPEGTVELSEGCIVAKRHMHLTPEDAEKMNLVGADKVKVRIGGERGLIFDEISVRVSEKFYTEIHLDHDEMNAAGLNCDYYGELVI